MGVGEPKLITWLTMSPASNEIVAAGQFAAQGMPQALAQSLAARRAGLEGELDDGFLRPAGEEMDQVDRVAGGHYAHEIAGDLDVAVSGFAADHVQRVEHHALGLLDARARRSPQTQAKQRRDPDSGNSSVPMRGSSRKSSPMEAAR